MSRAKVVDSQVPMRLGAGPMTEAVRALRDRERMLLQAYMHFGARDGGPLGMPGLCWPTDVEVGRYLGRSAITVRRSRVSLANAKAPWFTFRYVPPFGRLPDGSMCLHHGVNVVMLLKVGAPEEAPAVEKLVLAATTVRQLELDLAEAKARVRVLQEDVSRIHDQVAANDEGATPHNAPSVIPAGWSPRKTRPDREVKKRGAA